MENEKEEWDLTDLFGGKKEEEILKEVFAKKEEIKKKKEKLNDKTTPEIVLEIIKLNEQLDIELSKISAYYGLRSHANVNDEEAFAKLDYYKQIAAEIDNETMFFELWFISLEEKRAQEYIQNIALKKYAQHLKDLRKIKPYTKTEEIEQILNIKNITGKDAFSNIYEVLTASFKYDILDEKNITQEEAISKYTDEKPEVREAAYNAVLDVYKENSNTLTEIYKSIVLDWNNEKVKIRKYKNAIHPRHVSNDLTDDVIQTMIQVIRENAHLFQEYFKLKKEFLEKKGHPHKYSRYHIYAPYSAKKEYPYNESKKITLETFKEFDEEFYTYAKKIFDEKHVHSHPKKGKRSGAFCYAANNQITPYILLNHTNKIRDVFTMMHEVGHGIHDIYTFEQPNTLHHPVIPLAETASILAETILARKMLKTNNEEEKATILMHSLDHYYASILRQTYFVIFEEIAHTKIMRGATKKELDNEYYNLLKEQFGDMEIPEIFKHEWNYIPHIHNAPFYCYSYSFGNLLVLALYAEYEKNPEFKENIKNILRAGASKDTIKILKDENINIDKKEFWEKGFTQIKKEIEEFKKLIKNN